jgi:hypothetical protein
VNQYLPDDVLKIVNKFGVFTIRRVRVPEAMKDALLVNVVRIGNGLFWQIESALNLANGYLIIERLLEARDGRHDYWRLV